MDKSDSLEKQIKNQTIISILSQFGLTAVGFLATIYFARKAPPETVGYYYLLFSLYTLFILFSESGIGEASVKIMSEGKEKDEYYSASLFVRFVYLIFELLSILIIYILFPNSDIILSGLHMWLVVALVSDFLYSSRIYANYGQGNVNVYQIGLFLNTALRSVFQIVFVYLGYYLFGLNGGFIFGMIATAILTQKYIKLKLKKIDLNHVKRIFSFSLWIFLVMSSFLIHQNMDVVFLGAISGEETAAIYRIVYQFSMLAGLFAISAKAVLYPKFSAWNENKENEKIENALDEGLKFSLLLAIPIFFSFLVLGYDFISLFYGGVYTKGVLTLQILTAVQIVTVFMYLGGVCLNAISKPKESFFAIATGILLNIILNLLFIKNWGPEGAALATLAAISVSSIITFLILKKYINVKIPTISTLKMVFASIVMVIFLILFKKYIGIGQSIPILISVFTVGGLLYGFLMLLIDESIRDMFTGMMKGFVKIFKIK